MHMAWTLVGQSPSWTLGCLDPCGGVLTLLGGPSLWCAWKWCGCLEPDVLQGVVDTPFRHTQTWGGVEEEASVSTHVVPALVRGPHQPHPCQPSNHEEGLESEADHRASVSGMVMLRGQASRGCCWAGHPRPCQTESQPTALSGALKTPALCWLPSTPGVQLDRVVHP